MKLFNLADNRNHRNVCIAIILGVALMLRIYAGIRPDLDHDEKNWIKLTQKCSIIDGKINYVVHGDQHPVLPVYLIKLSSAVFGESNLGYRLVNILAGVLMLWVIYLIAQCWFGWQAALWSLVLLAFNEYHISISAFAVEKSFYLLFASLALYCFFKALHEDKPRLIMMSGIFIGLSFMCKEIAGLLVPVFFIFLLSSSYRCWFKRKEAYIAVFLFMGIISPDIYWNMTNQVPDPDGYVNYWDHLKRVGRFGFSIEPFAFYFHGIFNAIIAPMGLWVNESQEYPGPNIVWGSLCFFGVLFSLPQQKEPFIRLLLMMFFLIFGLLTFFTWVPDPVFDSGFVRVEWYWCDITLVPAVLLASHKIVQIKVQSRPAYYWIVALSIVAIGKVFWFVLNWY